jgi:hypothetical protein
VSFFFTSSYFRLPEPIYTHLLTLNSSDPNGFRGDDAPSASNFLVSARTSTSHTLVISEDPKDPPAAPEPSKKPRTKKKPRTDDAGKGAVVAEDLSTPLLEDVGLLVYHFDSFFGNNHLILYLFAFL